jgi:hypothetical protein
MIRSKKKFILALIISSNFIVPASFGDTTGSATTSKKPINGGVKKTTVSQSTQATWSQRHPKMKAAAVDGGIGAAAGGAVGLLTGRGMIRGAAIGAGTGAGVGVLRKTQIASRHPIASDTLTGTAAGLGLGLASGHEHRTGEAALLGGAAGLGVGLWKNRKNL